MRFRFFSSTSRTSISGTPWRLEGEPASPGVWPGETNLQDTIGVRRSNGEMVTFCRTVPARRPQTLHPTQTKEGCRGWQPVTALSCTSGQALLLGHHSLQAHVVGSQG